jgi:5-methylcytosine-specific restriction endonuclease McrA
MRSTPEWIGSTDDARVPPRVRLRIFEAHSGVCHLTGRKIMPGDKWDLDHIIALANGGKHAEFNLAPALKEPHRAKTKDDVKLKSRIARIRQRHLGIGRSRKKINSRGFPTFERQHSATRPVEKRELVPSNLEGSKP